MDITKHFIVMTILITACYGAKTTVLKLTTSTLPPPTVVTAPRITTRPSTLAPMPPKPMVCSDILSTTNPLARLRNAMKNASLTQMNAFFDAFLVFFSDAHLSDEPAPEERRLEYVSGWDGAGTAAVLADGGAALWVPPGELRRALETVSCAWIVYEADDVQLAEMIAAWIATQTSLGRNARVGGDARLTSWGEWQALTAAMQAEGLQLVPISTLLDDLWDAERDPRWMRPPVSRIVANLHHVAYTGSSWRDKVQMVRTELKAIGADAMVVTALDEVAWLLNVRGKDLPNAPLLKAFVLVSLKNIKVYVPAGKLSMPVREALAVYYCQANVNCTRVLEYEEIYADLRRAHENKILIPSAGTFQRGASAAIAQSVSLPKRIFQLSPIIYLKAQKNLAEIQGMRKAHLRDAVAMCTLLSYIEAKSKTGLTELSVAQKVDETRETQAGFVETSMVTRVAFEANGAEPEYRATNSSNRRIFANSTLVIYSGGQYDEGTTVVTRTVHYGAPTAVMRHAYTTVLRSLAALATLQVPATLPAAHIDPVARAPLWAAGQDYGRPTGHGVGAALNQREDPVVIDYRQDTNLHTLKEGYFITSEPAWYETNKFGVKLGNVLEVMSKKVPGVMGQFVRQEGYLRLSEATLLPFEPKLIDKSMLTEYEISWLNAYYSRIRTVVGPELKSQGLNDVYYWLFNKTVPLEIPSKALKHKSSAAEPTIGKNVAAMLVGLFMMFL